METTRTLRAPKRGTALFDLLTTEEVRAAEPLKIPGWWEREQSARGSVPERAPARPEPDSNPDPAPSGSPASEDQGGRMIELDGNRVRISLTSMSGAIVAFVALVVLLGGVETARRFGEREGFRRGHVAGRASYATDTVSEIEAARRQPPSTDIVKDLLRDAEVPPLSGLAIGGEASSEPIAPGWVRGLTYIVAQEFGGQYEEHARRAQEFLAEHGIETELVRYVSGSMQLLTVQGDNRTDPAQRRMADELLAKVHQVGAKYFSGGGGYKLDGYFRTLKGEHW